MIEAILMMEINLLGPSYPKNWVLGPEITIKYHFLIKNSKPALKHVVNWDPHLECLLWHLLVNF